MWVALRSHARVASRSQGTNFETKIFNFRWVLALLTETSFTTPHYYPKYGYLHHLAVSRVRYAGPQVGRRGQLRTEEAEIALTTSFLRKSLSVCGVRSQARLLLGRLDVLGPGAAAAALRRNYALQLERRWAQQRRADALSSLQGRSILRRGHFKMD